MISNNFTNRVIQVVLQIPKGHVMTYGQIAVICGSPRAARIVGGVAHFGDSRIPWHRIVKKDGSLAEGYPGGTEGHGFALANDGVRISKEHRVVNLDKILWHPKI